MTATSERMRALSESSNRLRSERARVKRALHAQPNSSAARHATAVLLEHPSPALLQMRVEVLLRAGRYQGQATAVRFLRRAGISESAVVEGLTGRQRRALVGALRGG